MVRYFFGILIFLVCSNTKAQDTTLTFTKEEFAKIKFIKQALKGLPANCIIQSYDISMYMINGVKTKSYMAGQKDQFTPQFLDHAAKNGREMTISKLKTSCVEGSYKTKYVIVVK
jgi:hypothetical protein